MRFHLDARGQSVNHVHPNSRMIYNLVSANPMARRIELQVLLHIWLCILKQPAFDEQSSHQLLPFCEPCCNLLAVIWIS